jgi:hypothetical protein
MKRFKTRSKPILKNVVVSKYDKITLKLLKEKPNKVHKNKISFRYFYYIPMGRKKIKKNKFISI